MIILALFDYLTSDAPEADMADAFNASDWGTSAWAEDKDWAFSQAWEWMATTATARGWSEDPDVYQSGETYLLNAYSQSANTEDFWNKAAQGFAQGPVTATASLPIPAGWDKLANTFAMAGSTTVTVEEARELGKPTTMLKAAAEKTIVEIKDKGGTFWDVAKPYAIGGGVILGLVTVGRILK